MSDTIKSGEDSAGGVGPGAVVNGPLRFWISRARHKMRWLLWVAATGCGLAGANAPTTIAPALRGAGIVLFAVGVVAWWFERRAFRLIATHAARADQAWQEHAKAAPETAVPDWIDRETFFALAEPDFWLVAEQQLLVGDWRIDKYLDQEWKLETLPLIEKFYDVTADEKERAPRHGEHVPTAAPKSPPRAIETMDHDGALAQWARCCGAPARVVAMVDGNGRRVGDLELPFLRLPPHGEPLTVDLDELPQRADAWPVYPGLGLECATCGGRYAPSNPDFLPPKD